MKKLILIVIVLFTFSQVTYAQHGSKHKGGKKGGYNGYYGFSIGPSFPMGDFAGTSTDPDAESQGFAKTGINITFANFGYKIIGPVGIAAQLFAGANRADLTSIDLEDKDAYWSQGGIMIGPMASFDIGPISIDLRPVYGVSLVFTPELNTNDGAVLYKSDHNTAGSYDLGATIRLHFSERGSIAFNLDYYGCDVDFKRDEVATSQKVNTLSTGLGLVFAF